MDNFITFLHHIGYDVILWTLFDDVQRFPLVFVVFQREGCDSVKIASIPHLEQPSMNFRSVRVFQSLVKPFNQR